MVEQDPVAGEHLIRLPRAPGQLKTSYFADPVRRARMETSRHSMRNFNGLGEHLAPTSEIEAAPVRESFPRNQQIMRASNIGIQRRKFFVEGVAYKALGSQMVTLVGPHLRKNLIDARETLQRSG